MLLNPPPPPRTPPNSFYNGYFVTVKLANEWAQAFHRGEGRTHTFFVQQE